jgi:histone deacetylase 1/2
MFVYVDDIVIAGSTPAAVDRLVASLSETFFIKDLGTLQYFLGLEASYNSGSMILTQWKHALDLLHCVSMENHRATATPLATTERLAHETGTTLGVGDSFRYRSIVGGLQYLMSLVLVCLLWSTRCVSFYHNRLICIGTLSSVFRDI